MTFERNSLYDTEPSLMGTQYYYFLIGGGVLHLSNPYTKACFLS